MSVVVKICYGSPFKGDLSGNEPPAKRRRRKRRKGAPGKKVGESASDMSQKPSVHHALCDEPLPIPAALLGRDRHKQSRPRVGLHEGSS